MLWTLITLLVVFWIVGTLADIGGGFIHFLLGAALLLFLINLFTGRRVGV